MFLALRRKAGSYGLSSSMDRWRGLCRAVIQVEAKLELGRIRHEAGMPWRIEHDFHMNFLDTWQPREPALHVRLEHVAHPATGSTHGHFDMNPVPTLLQGRNRSPVYPTQ